MAAVIPLPISFPWEGGQQTLFPTLLLDGSDAVLVDCGYPGFLPRLEAALRAVGASPADLTAVVITHHDDDHMGALAQLKRACPQVRVLAGAEEAPYISGEKKSLRLIQAEALQPTLPPEAQEWGRQFCRRLNAVEPAPVDGTLHGGDLLPWCGGCQVIATPGHTPGHISLFLPALSMLIPGDAAVVEHGALAVANPQFALDLPAAEQSLDLLRSLPWDTCLCYHGGIFRRQRTPTA
jgi:glyoxylase-like metal-dependent hydrolase (beta-lactamase superfamily II)